MKRKKQVLKYPNPAWAIEQIIEKHYVPHIQGTPWTEMNTLISAKGNHLRDQIILKLKKSIEVGND